MTKALGGKRQVVDHLWGVASTAENRANVAIHEAGHTVIANRHGFPIESITTGPAFHEGAISDGGMLLGDGAGDVIEAPGGMAKYHSMLAGGQAAEERYGLNPAEIEKHIGGDKMISEQMSGPNAAADWKAGLGGARTMLNGELSGQHTKLTDFISQNWGKTLKFEQFSHLLKILPVAVAGADAVKLYSNYLQGSGRLPDRSGKKSVTVMADPKQPGLITPGNIDLYNRPSIPNPDGKMSTVFSSSYGINGKEVLLPRAADGKILTDKEAVARYRDTGEHLGIFDTPANATAYARQLHNDYEAGKYNKKVTVKADPASDSADLPLSTPTPVTPLSAAPAVPPGVPAALTGAPAPVTSAPPASSVDPLSGEAKADPFKTPVYEHPDVVDNMRKMWQ